MRRRDSRPRSPFVITVALAAAAGACGGSTVNDSGSGTGGKGGTGTGATGGSGGGPKGGTGGIGGGGIGGGDGGCGANPPSITCPEIPPVEGASCPTAPGCHGFWWGSTCQYPDPCGGAEPVQYDCAGPTWKIISGSPTCSTCPTTEPVAGSACSLPPEQMCTYPIGCCGIGYSCVGGQWLPQPTPCPQPPELCPASPPNPGDACDPCTTAPECVWDTCATLGKVTKGSCPNGVWSLMGAPCAADAGTP